MKTIIILQSENIPATVSNLLYQCNGSNVYAYAQKRISHLRELRENLKDRLQALHDNPPQPVDDLHLFADESEEEAWFNTINMVEKELTRIKHEIKELNKALHYLYSTTY